MTTHEESMAIILEKADQVAKDTLIAIETQLKTLGITDVDMIIALQFAIATKMQEQIKAKLPQ